STALTTTVTGGTTAAIGTQTNGAAIPTATTSITRTDEVQTLTFGGSDGGTVQLGFQNTATPPALAGTQATELTVIAGASPTKAQVLDHLNSIAALTGNVKVDGNAGGPFT